MYKYIIVSHVYSHVLRSPLILQGDTTHLIYSYHTEDPVDNEQF